MKFLYDEQVASQPQAVQAVLERAAPPRLDLSRPLLFAGLGTSLHACRVAAAWAGFPAQALDAHELALRLPVPRDAQVVVVTHGGHGTVMKALAAGVPLVILPHGRDQADTAARVTARSAGIALKRTAKRAVVSASSSG